jgi:CRP-like cAMP-binding protein
MRAPVQVSENVCHILSRVAYFQGMPEEALSRLGEHSHVMTLRKDDVLVEQGPTAARNVYAVLDGQIHLGLPTTDTVRSLRIIDPVMTLGESVLLTQTAAPYRAVATRKSRVLVIDGARWLHEIKKVPELSWEVLRHLAQRRLEVMQMLATSSRRTDLSRVAAYLMEFKPKVPSESFSFELPARKLDIAANLGMSNASFSRALQHLKKDDLIQVTGSCIHVLKTTLLDHVAQA